MDGQYISVRTLSKVEPQSTVENLFCAILKLPLSIYILFLKILLAANF